MSLIVVTFLATFCFTVLFGSPLLLLLPYLEAWMMLPVSTLFALLTSVFVWTQSASPRKTSGRGRRLGTGAVLCYLTTGAGLAITRVAQLVWLNHRLASHVVTQSDSFIVGWLYPEFIVSNFGGSLAALYGTAYYLTWGTLVTVGSFMMATPILLVAWLRQSPEKS